MSMISIGKKHVSSGKSLSSVIMGMQRITKSIYPIILVLLTFILIFIKNRDVILSLRYSLGFIGIILFSLLLDYPIVQGTVIKKQSLLYGLFSLFLLSYALTILYSLYIVQMNSFSKILSVWVPYSILMTMLVIYYSSFSALNALSVGAIHSIITIGALFHDIDFKMFLISMCVLAIPNIIIAGNLETRFLFVKTKDIAKAYLSTFSKSFEYLENIQDIISEEKRVFSDIFMFKNNRGQIFWVVNNYFHYGPFMSIGSSEIPKMLLAALKNVLVFKGPATHRENISTSKRARRVTKRIVNSAMHMRTKELMARYCVVERDKFRVHCLDLSGFVICFVDILEEGYDDIPQEPLKDMLWRKDLCIVDLHVSRGSHNKLRDFTRRDFQILKSLIESAMESVQKIKYVQAEVSYASFLPEGNFTDIYSGGVHAILFKIGQLKILILDFDGNNMEWSFKTSLIKYLKDKGYEPIISTTDSHEKATPLGDYYMIGDTTRFEDFKDVINDMIRMLERNLSHAIFGHRKISHKTKILGDNWLSLLHHSLKTSKRVFILILLQVVLIMCLLPLSLII